MTKQNIQVLIAEIDENSCFSFLSQSFEDTLGYSQNELLNQNLQKIVHPADLREFIQEIAIADKEPTVNTSRFITKNGNYLTCRWTFHSYQNPKKERKVVIVSNLVSDSESNRNSNFEIERKNFHDLFLVTSLRGKILHVNPAFCSVCKYAREELIGRNHKLFSSEFHPKIFFQEMRRTIHSGRVWRAEVKNRAKDGSVHWLDTVIVPAKDDNGKITHFLEVRKEITEAKIAKSEVGDKMDLLKQRIAELEKKEKKLIEVNQLLTTVLDTTPTLVANLDSRFNFILVNQAYAKSCNQSISYFEGKNHFELFPHEENQRIFQQVVETGQPYYIESKPFEYPDQPERGVTYWDWSLVPVKDQDGNVTSLVFTLEEVTNRVKVKQITEIARLLEQESHKKLQDAYLKITQRQFAIDQHAIVAITNRAGKIIYVNERFCEISQYSKDELLGQNHRIINSNFHPKEFFTAMYSEIQKGNIWHGEIRNRAKDGSFYWVATTIVPFKDSNGKIEQYFSIRTVITNRIQAEEALKVSQANMQAILDNSFESIFLFDPEQKLKFFNQISLLRSQEVFGKRLEMGESISSLLSPIEREKFVLYFESALKGKRIIFDKSIVVDGFEYWFEIQFAPVVNVQKQNIGVLVTARDIGEKKRAEKEFKKYTQDLEKLNQTKDKFFNIIAHDLRNPFAGIIGVSEILITRLEEMKTEEAKQLLHYNKIVLNTSKSSYNLLENLLFWAKTQTGDIQMNLTNLRFDFLVSHVISVVNINAVKKNIQIELDVEDNSVVFADESSVNTILRNLITNAIKFTYPNGKVKVSAKRKEMFLEVSILDNGVGMSSKQLDRIFRIDAKSSRPGTENEQGTGLGLILCKELIQKQGGDICVESQLGIGSTFIFTLPLGKAS